MRVLGTERDVVEMTRMTVKHQNKIVICCDHINNDLEHVLSLPCSQENNVVGEEKIVHLFDEVSCSTIDESAYDCNHKLPHCVSSNESIEISKQQKTMQKVEKRL